MPYRITYKDRDPHSPLNGAWEPQATAADLWKLIENDSFEVEDFNEDRESDFAALELLELENMLPGDTLEVANYSGILTITRTA